MIYYLKVNQIDFSKLIVGYFLMFYRLSNFVYNELMDQLFFYE